MGPLSLWAVILRSGKRTGAIQLETAVPQDLNPFYQLGSCLDRCWGTVFEVNTSAVFISWPPKRPFLEVHEKKFYDLYARNIFACFECDGVFYFAELFGSWEAQINLWTTFCFVIFIFIYLLCWVIVVTHRIFVATSGIFCWSMPSLRWDMWDLVLWPGTELGPPALRVLGTTTR